jgi:hypothetical protein
MIVHDRAGTMKLTRILAFDFDLCVCDGEGFFELFIQLLEIYELTRLQSKTLGGFSETIERTYKLLASECASATKAGNLALFRPGIENVFRVAQQMKKQGLIQYILFYSNNSCPEFLSFVELVIRLTFPVFFSPRKPVVELVFTANSSSRMRVEYAPANQPNAREKTKKGVLTCLEDLDLPVTEPSELLFFDDMTFKGLGDSLRLVPEYHALHTAKQIYEVFLNTFEKSGFFVNGSLARKWIPLGFNHSLMKLNRNSDLLRNRVFQPSSQYLIEKEKKICSEIVAEIYKFCLVSSVSPVSPVSPVALIEKKKRKKRAKKNIS